jgi:uncharacterized membrane protein
MQEKMNRGRSDILLTFILLLGAALRLFRLGNQSFWWDEVYSASLSAQSLGTVIPRFGQTPAFYHVLLHFWQYLGRGDGTVRLLSVLCGVATLWVIYRLGVELLDRNHGLMCAFLIAISPFHIWYSQEARMYSLLILLCTAATLFFVRFLKRSPGWPGLWWILLTVLGLYTHYYALFVLGFQFLFLIIFWRQYRLLWPRVFRAMLVIALLIVPILLLFFPGGKYAMVCAEGAGRNPLRLFSVPYTFFTFSQGFSYGPSVAELQRLTAWPTVRPYMGSILPAAVFYAVLFVMGLRALWSDRRRLVFLLLYLFTPIAAACLIVLFMPQLSYNVRYVSMVLPAYGLILASGLLAPAGRLVRRGLLALMLILVTISLLNYYTDTRYHKEDFRRAVDIISRNERPDDVVLGTHLRPIKYYYQGDMVIHNLLWSPLFYRRMIDVRLQRYKRAWVLISRSWVSDPENKMLEHMRGKYSAVRETTFTGLYLGLFDLKREPQEDR